MAVIRDVSLYPTEYGTLNAGKGGCGCGCGCECGCVCVCGCASS